MLGITSSSGGTVAPIGEKVAVDSAATSDYLGAAGTDGALRVTTNQLTLTDGGNYVTLGLADHATARAALGLEIGVDIATYAHAMSTHSDEDSYNISTSGSAAASKFTVGTPVVGDLYGGLLYGTYAAAKTVTAQSSNVMPIQVHIDSQTNADAATKHVMAGYFKAKATTAAQANNQLQCIIGRMDADVNLTAAYGIQMHATRDSGTSTEIAAGSFLLDLEDGGSTGGLAWALRADIGSTGAGATRQASTIASIFSITREVTDHNIYAENQGSATTTNMLYLNNAGTCTNGVYLNGTYTNDIVLQNGEVIKNATDGTIEYSGFLGEDLTSATPSAAFTIDWRTGNFQKITITGVALAATFTAPGSCGRGLLHIVQGDGDDTIDWSGVTVKWPGDVEPTLSTGSGDIDIIGFWYDGTTWHGVANFDFV